MVMTHKAPLGCGAVTLVLAPSAKRRFHAVPAAPPGPQNDATLTNRALDSLACRRRVLLSGTPLQNRLDEFYGG